MHNANNRSLASATKPYVAFLGCAGCAALALLLTSCSTIPPARRENRLQEDTTSTLRYSMVFMIHGDGDYLYHDNSGNAHRADEEALGGATRVATRNPQAEVFVFHQRPRRHTLLLFPRRDGDFYYYRRGRLIAKESYWRNQGQTHFSPEAALYHKYHAAERLRSAGMFLYFGHEIPEFGGAGYDASYSDRPFTVHDLAGGLEHITHDSATFDLIVLSTCYNGTPHTIATLAPYARTIIASPGNLHLSYFDLRSLERMDTGTGDGDTTFFAKQYAQQAFDRLTQDVQTAVTVAVYDVDRVRGYVNRVDSVYEQALTILERQKPGSFEHHDCADDSAYMLPGMSDGVEVFYRPPRFGRLKNKQNHSGWECWTLPDRSSPGLVNPSAGR